MNIYVSKSFFTMFIFVVSIVSCVNLYGATNSGFKYQDQKSIFVFSDFYETGKYSKVSKLLFVDFKNKNKIILDEGEMLGGAQVDEKSKYVLYKKGSLWKVVNYDNRENIYKYKSKNSEFYLIKNGKMLSGVDYAKNKYVVIDIDRGGIISVEYNNEYVWGSDWDKLCGCVVFEVSKKPNSEHYLIGLIGDELKVINKKSTLNKSPSGENSIVVHEGESDDSNTVFKILLENGNSRVYNISGPIKNNEIIWSDDTVRILNSYALLDLKNADLMYQTAYLWESFRSESAMKFDLSGDKSGYVFKWDMKTKIFEVEDINTGKIIKTYKKFW